MGSATIPLFPSHPDKEKSFQIYPTKEDLRFPFEDLEEGCRSGIYQEVDRAHVDRAIKRGVILSSASTVWQESEDGRKGRFVVNLCKQSKHWYKGSIRVESIGEFAMSL